MISPERSRKSRFIHVGLGPFSHVSTCLHGRDESRTFPSLLAIIPRTAYFTFSKPPTFSLKFSHTFSPRYSDSFSWFQWFECGGLWLFQSAKMWQRTFPKSDVEAGARPLYPMMLENPQLRWAFIRKIYSIVAVQLLLTIAVAAVVVTVHPIAYFFVSTGAGLALYIVLIFVPFIGMFCTICFCFSCFLLFWTRGLTFWFFGFWIIAVLCPLYYYHQRHPVNYLLLGVFTVSLAFVVGLTCAFTSGKNS